jgi:hypothetical protein
VREAGPAEAPKPRLLDRVRHAMFAKAWRRVVDEVTAETYRRMKGLRPRCRAPEREGKHADTSGRHSPLAARWHRRCHLLLRQLEVVRPVVIASSARYHLLPVFCGES